MKISVESLNGDYIEAEEKYEEVRYHLSELYKGGRTQPTYWWGYPELELNGPRILALYFAAHMANSEGM
jgi:hypothetical protein